MSALILHGHAVAVAVLLASACTSPTTGGTNGVSATGPEALLTGDVQREALCSRARSDLIIDSFCGDEPPSVSSLIELRELLGIASNVNDAWQGFAVIGHSTSLSGRAVSAINPRVIFIRYPREEADVEMLALAFTRGEGFAEIVVPDRLTGGLQFYLTTFSLGCDVQIGGCIPADLLTAASETGWRGVNVYAEEDLANTPRDCRVCHQPEGPGTPKLMRMQEFTPPWNHWLRTFSVAGRALVSDYDAAKGDEPLAGVPAQALHTSNPGLLSSLLFFSGFGEQPNAFESSIIEREVIDSALALGGNQPVDNSVPGESPTWQAIYDRASRGEAIPVPYHDVKVTDIDKLAVMTEAYADYRQERMARERLPDIRDIFPDDPERLARMGFATDPGLDGQGVLLQACAMCHNDRLDQTLSRARFNVDLTKVEPEGRQLAIARIQLPVGDPGVMPPARFRRLGEEARRRLVELLER